MKTEDKHEQRYIQLKHGRTVMAVDLFVIVNPSDWKLHKEKKKKMRENYRRLEKATQC